MTSPTAEQWVLRLVDGAVPSRPLILLMRHAERGPLPVGTAGSDVPLRPEGIRAATALGDAFGARLASLHTSPVLRCMQTATAMALGSRKPLEPRPDNLLGAPGAFVSDSELAWENWQHLGHAAVMGAAIEGRQLPGMADPRKASRQLLSHMVNTVGHVPGIHVFVTHDSLLAPAVAHTVHVDMREQSTWPRFLEAMALVRGRGGFAVRWREHQIDLPMEPA